MLVQGPDEQIMSEYHCQSANTVFVMQEIESARGLRQDTRKCEKFLREGLFELSTYCQQLLLNQSWSCRVQSVVLCTFLSFMPFSLCGQFPYQSKKKKRSFFLEQNFITYLFTDTSIRTEIPCKILLKRKKWVKIKTNYDNYIGYIKNDKFLKNFKPSYKISKIKSRIFD